MSSWHIVKLDEVARRGSGHTPSKRHPEYWGGSVKWLSLRDTFRLDQGAIEGTSATITESGLANSSAVVHSPGSVVLLRDAGIGRSGVIASAMAVSQHFMVWSCGPRLNNWFLYYLLQFRRPELERVSNGSTIKTIGLDYFRQLEIPLPDIKEQEAIALSLRDCDHQISALERLISKKQAIKQGMMQQLLTGETRLPGFSEPWCETSIDKVASIDTDALPASTDPSALFDYVSLEDVERGDLLGYSRVRFGSAPSRARRVIKEGDVLFGTVRPNLQSHTIYRGGLRRPIASTGFAVVRSVNERTDAHFLFYLLMSHLTTVQVDRIIAGSNYPAVASADVRRFTFAFPQHDEQRAIGSVLVDCDSEISALRRRLTKARRVKQGMMQELLTGRTRLPVEATV